MGTDSLHGAKAAIVTTVKTRYHIQTTAWVLVIHMYRYLLNITDEELSRWYEMKSFPQNQA